MRYAVAPQAGPSTIAIRASRLGADVRNDVIDSGAGFDRDRVSEGSHGLALSERRLQVFDPGARLVVENRGSGGCGVR